MAPAPQEVDVFSGPHSRMKELVRMYSDKLTATDFSNYIDLRGFLWSLRSTFREFKTHECIENECIMQKLKHRLDFLKIENQAVYNVHSDNRLSEIQDLLEEGCDRTEHCHSPSEMITIGSNIRETLEVFTKAFLPHMQEEEELFQPLLMKYFTYEELKSIRYDVIEKHALHTKYCSDGSNEFVDERLAEKVDEVKDEEDNTPACKIAGLPSEVLLQILSYLNPKELCQCAQVNMQWNQLAMDGGLWKHLHPIRWAQGDWRFIVGGFDQDIQVASPESDDDDYVTVDEDADFDESESSADSDEQNNCEVSQSVLSIRREAKLLDGISRHLIPIVGHGVETLVLSQSKALNNAVVYRLLTNSPNLKHLDLSLTKVSDLAFKGFGKNGSGKQLQHLNLSGCTSITDATLKRLASAISPPQDHDTNHSKKKTFLGCEGQSHIGDSCSRHCCGGISIDEAAVDKNGRPKSLCAQETIDSSSCSGGKGSHEVPRHDTSHNAKRASGLTGTGHDPECAPTSEAFHVKPNERTNICQLNNVGVDSAYQTEDDDGSVEMPDGIQRTCCANILTVQDKPEDLDSASESSRLEFLSLAGCYKISDKGLRYLAECGGLPYLEHLDLSGCVHVTSAGLNQLAAACTELIHEEFFYCDNIAEGPYADTASGCQNLQCQHLVCCRSGE